MSDIGGRLTVRNMSRDESAIFGPGPTWVDFVDALKEQYYPVGNYDDQYMRWTTLCQERDQMVSEYTNIFHTFAQRWVLKTLSDTWF
jgi:hypothetical protein